MVSKQEVAAAFKAAAEALGVDDDELGDLAYTLSKLSEEELEFVPIRASNKAIVAFARKGRRIRLVVPRFNCCPSNLVAMPASFSKHSRAACI